MNWANQRNASITAMASPEPKSNRPTSSREEDFRGPRVRRGTVGDVMGKPMILVEMIPNPIERTAKTSIVSIGDQL